MGEAEPSSYKTNRKVAQFCLQVPHLGAGRHDPTVRSPRRGKL